MGNHRVTESTEREAEERFDRLQPFNLKIFNSRFLLCVLRDSVVKFREVISAAFQGPDEGEAGKKVIDVQGFPDGPPRIPTVVSRVLPLIRPLRGLSSPRGGKTVMVAPIHLWDGFQAATRPATDRRGPDSGSPPRLDFQRRHARCSLA